MSSVPRTQEEEVSLNDSNSLRDDQSIFDDDPDKGTNDLSKICLLISASNSFDVNCSTANSSNHLEEPLASTHLSCRSAPFRFLDLPFEIRDMIYHQAIGNHFLHIYSNCWVIPHQIRRCSDEDPHQCLKSNPREDDTIFPFISRSRLLHGDFSPLVHCQGSVLFHNRICTSRHINVGDRNGYWSLSLSHDIQSGQQTIEHGTRDSADSANTKPLDYCPCIQRSKTSLSLTLLQTCKQIHKEAAMVPYESNTFIFQEAETFAAFLGLVYPRDNDSNNNPIFSPSRSIAIQTMRNVRLHSRAISSGHFLDVTRLLRGGLSLLTGLRTFELTLGLHPHKRPAWSIDDSLFGISRSVRTVTVNIRDYIWTAQEYRGAGQVAKSYSARKMEGKQDFAENLMERMLKRDRFRNQQVWFFSPVQG